MKPQIHKTLRQRNDVTRNLRKKKGMSNNLNCNEKTYAQIATADNKRNNNDNLDNVIVSILALIFSKLKKQ